MSGVSSMMTSTPVASSNARMLRPSRPMMRPFISSFGSETAETVRLGGVLGRDALDGERDDLLRLALGVALARVSRISRMRLAASACASSSIRRISSALASCADMPASCSSRRRSSPTSLSSSCSRCVEGLLARPMVVGAARGLALALLEQVELAIEMAFAFGDPALFALDLLAAPADLGFPLLAELDQLFLSREHRGLAQRSRLRARLRRGCAWRSLRRWPWLAACRRELGAPLRAFCRQRKKPRRQERTEVCRARVTTPCSSYRIYVGPAANATGGPYRAGKSSRS